MISAVYDSGPSKERYGSRPLARTDTAHAPWHVVQAGDKRRARLNCIQHLLSQIPYEDLSPPPIELGEREPGGRYRPRALDELNLVPDRYRDE